MSFQLEPYPVDAVTVRFPTKWLRLIERVILKLADKFHIRLEWNWDTAIMTGTFALAGGLIGGFVGGRVGAAVGAGIGGVTGLGVATWVSLRDIWDMVKDKLQELMYIVFNYLRRLDYADLKRAYRILMASTSNQKELVLSIVEFIIETLGKQVTSTITAA